MSYYHLTINERCCIYNFLKLGLSIREIAKALHRSPSTISREIRRNAVQDSHAYFPACAQEHYVIKRLNCHRKSVHDEKIIHYIESRIQDYWSPEQIANRHCDGLKNIPSTSTIYRMIHRHQIPSITMRHLRGKGKFKRPSETRGKFNDGGRTIKKRPREVYKREELGHWEADTVESGRNDHQRITKNCFVTLAERKSRYYIAIPVPDKKAEHVSDAIIETLKTLPKELVKTITFDRGKEFSKYEKIEEALSCSTYFCDPYCPWQKGTNENSNGLLREFYPKGSNLSKVDEEKLKHYLILLNNRPRKCLNFHTPIEILFGSSLT